MKSSYFWERSTLNRFKIVFENADTVFGRNAANEFRTFRKDGNIISFSEREVLEIRLAELAGNKEPETDEKERFGAIRRNLSLRSCFG
ncbi:MAG: hypothetical protein IPJ30_17395 [Acidobacteria bacterium]|nr:hypothetical protein [Acidobacteriota bacterium]MBK8151484.1 hypothetical protein [Acidobacteriota bacterium]